MARAVQPTARWARRASSANAKRSAAIGWAASTVFGGFTVDAAAAQDGK